MLSKNTNRFAAHASISNKLKLNKTYADFCKTVKGTSLTGDAALIVNQIVYDTRKIVHEENTIFFALTGEFRDGHTFLEAAFSKGIRMFVVSKDVELEKFPGAHFIKVKDCLNALQDLAHAHRIQFNYQKSCRIQANLNITA